MENKKVNKSFLKYTKSLPIHFGQNRDFGEIVHPVLQYSTQMEDNKCFAVPQQNGIQLTVAWRYICAMPYIKLKMLKIILSAAGQHWSPTCKDDLIICSFPNENSVWSLNASLFHISKYYFLIFFIFVHEFKAELHKGAFERELAN